MKLEVKKTSVPESSMLRQYLPADHADSFVCTGGGKRLEPDDVMVSFWTDMPGWVGALFWVRNFLVRFVGLKGDDNGGMAKLEEAVRTGASYGVMQVVGKSVNETAMLMTDKHLDAYISVITSDNGAVWVNTLVKYNNGLGRFYFFVIRPFHAMVVRGSLKRSVAVLAGKER